VGFGDHMLSDAVSRVSLLTKDDVVPDGQQVKQRDEDLVFALLALPIHVELPYRVDWQLIPL